MKNWDTQKTSLAERLADGRRYASGKTVEAVDLSNFLQAVIRSGDRVCLEGDNQKQADVLAAALANIDPAKVHDLHMIQSGVVLPEHLDVFEKGIARRLEYSYSGPQEARIARMVFGGKIELGAVHTYLELFARYFVDLTPNVALIAAVSADKDGNLYTGPNTEDTPTVVEATTFKSGLVVAQVAEILDQLPRVDVPGDQVHFVVEAKKPFYVEPLFTRDPAEITENQILTAMLAIKGLYAPYGIRRLLGFVAGRMRTIDNHHVGEINALIICPAGFSVCGDRSAQRVEMMAQGSRSAFFFHR
jgi:malonate decarboxylase alpha subunit